MSNLAVVEEHTMGVRQRSGEGVVRGNGCPKGCFWRVRFFSVPLRFALKTPKNLEGTEKKRTLQKHPFGQPFPRTTPFSAPLARSDTRSLQRDERQNSLGSWTSIHLGHGRPHPNARFSKVLRACPKFLTRDARPICP